MEKVEAIPQDLVEEITEEMEIEILEVDLVQRVETEIILEEI